METENNQETDADLESQDSAGDNSENFDSVQNTGDENQGSQTDEQDDSQDAHKKPKVWQVVRGMQKSIEELQKNLTPKTQAPQQQADNGLSPKDLYALLEAKVPQADVDEVVRASKLLGKSIPEVLNDGLIKARLKDLAEQRQTANATNTSGSKRTTVKLTDEGLVEQARQGKDVDPEALAAARINLKKAQRK